MSDKIEGNMNFLLTKVDQMRHAADLEEPAPATPEPPKEQEPPVERGRVLFCQRDAQIAGNVVHLKHHWLKTTTREAGMGAEGGGVPGGRPDLPGVRTTVNDHAGQSREAGSECTPLPTVDEACVNDELRLGRHTGRWLPDNNCQTFVRQVIDHCAPPAPSADEQWLESKGIASPRGD